MQLPNATFWSSLPGLVGDGFKFAFVDCFGASGGAKVAYSTAPSGGVTSTGSAEPYKPMTSNSGYGAL
jgi:hypothetical protein